MYGKKSKRSIVQVYHVPLLSGSSTGGAQHFGCWCCRFESFSDKYSRLVQSVEQRSDIAEVIGSIPVATNEVFMSEEWVSIRHEWPYDEGEYTIKDCRLGFDGRAHYNGYEFDIIEFHQKIKGSLLYVSHQDLKITHWKRK